MYCLLILLLLYFIFDVLFIYFILCFILSYFYSLTLLNTLICPAGAFWAKYLISCESEVACKFLKKVPEGFKSRFDRLER